MRKLRIFLLIAVIFIFSVIILSPLLSLLCPEKLTKRTYYSLLYHVIADKETAGSRIDEEKAIKLLRYVASHEFAQGKPFECKPAESLVYGEAYCDFQSRTLNSLLAAVGIKSRYVMLMDGKGVSPHTVNEVFLNGKWCVFGPLRNMVFRDKNGTPLSLKELSDQPDLIAQQNKFSALEKYDKREFENWVREFSRMFPLPEAPQRSVPTIFQKHIFDHVTDKYYALFKDGFFNFYQDLYLKYKINNRSGDDLKLFLTARNLHLAYRYQRAAGYYDVLLNKHPDSRYAQDAIFFKSMLYFDSGDFSKAQDSFCSLIANYPEKWHKASYYFLGRIYDALGKEELALAAYRQTSPYGLTTNILKRLNGEN